MKKLSKFSKIIMVVAIFAMVLSFASCGPLGGGALKLESFTVDRTSVKTQYLVGEEIDFSGIKATVKYSDESLNKIYRYDDLKFDYPDDITATVGEKEVSVYFQDPHLNVKQETKVKITVTEKTEIDTSEPLEVQQFEAPSSISAFLAANKLAGTDEYGSTSFQGVFAKQAGAYIIGNENAFIFNPKFTVLDADYNFVELKEFYTTVEISVKVNDEYVALTKEEDDKVVKYYDGDVLIAEVNIYEGSYQFTVDAADKNVKISVLPSAEHFVYDGAALVLEAKVVNAYNVYEAWQLAVIDNYNKEWDELKTERGLKDINVSGIVLHGDIQVTSEDVPASFFLTTDKDIQYFKATDTDKANPITIPTGTKYLKDWTLIYNRVGADDFVIEGNLFTLSVADFPVVPSPAVFGGETDDDDYGVDFSNAVLFKFDSTAKNDEMAKPEDIAVVNINNLQLIGNTGRDNLVDSQGNLVSAGGLILMKSSYFSDVTVKNAIGNSFFISYFVDSKATLSVYDVKCYDSYQNVAFAWGECTLNFIDSYLNGCGGPVICATSEYNINRHPVVNVTGGKIETHLSGSEIWFSALNATTAVSGMKTLSSALQAAGLGSFVDSDGNMNIKGLLMADGYDAPTVIGGFEAQGSFFIDGEGMNRFVEQNPDMATIIAISKGAYAMSGNAVDKIPPFLTVYGADGTAYTVYYNGTGLVDLAGRTLGTDLSHQAIMGAFMTAKTLTLTQGGLTVIFDFYH